MSFWQTEKAKPNMSLLCPWISGILHRSQFSFHLAILFGLISFKATIYFMVWLWLWRETLFIEQTVILLKYRHYWCTYEEEPFSFDSIPWNKKFHAELEKYSHVKTWRKDIDCSAEYSGSNKLLIHADSLKYNHLLYL